MSSGKRYLVIGASFGFLGVGVGAFGAHALSPLLEATQKKEVFDLAARYQLFHSLALMIVGLLSEKYPKVTYAGFFFTVGILIFCGSLFLLSITGQSWLGALTPIGGLCFLSGWSIFDLCPDKKIKPGFITRVYFCISLRY